MPCTSDAASTGRAIGIARVICIVGMVYVHAWTGLTGPQLGASDHTAQGLLRWALSDLLGRAAVPLLSLISGWLAVGSLRRRRVASFVGGKVRTVLLPMVLWNALAVALVGGAAWMGWISGPAPSSWSWVANELLCLTHPADIDVQMAFLRDLFVCLLLAPALSRLGLALQAGVAVAALAWALSGVDFPLLLRPTILMFFVLGMMAPCLDALSRAASLPVILLGAPYLGLAVTEIVLATRQSPPPIPFAAQSALDIALRTAAAMVFWAVSWRLAGSRFAGALLAFEPYVFLLFCSHLIMIWLAGPVIGAVTGPLGAPLYPLFLVAQPAMTLAASVTLGRALGHWAPNVAEVLTGGRVASAPRAGGDRKPSRDARRADVS
jgi:hypothetical protein